MTESAEKNFPAYSHLPKASGEIIEGVTDDEGMTPLLDMTEMDEMKMEILPNE
ncbi:hypothetical protein [Citrobacter freundii]|uniref:hypothetical protein n=1 Tax=Citrobacter freundii TaxID=546 RepID=UPI0038907765